MGFFSPLVAGFVRPAEVSHGTLLFEVAAIVKELSCPLFGRVRLVAAVLDFVKGGFDAFDKCLGDNLA